MTQDQHDYIEHGKEFDHVNQDCPTCDGSGRVNEWYSKCCGDDIINGICIDCKEVAEYDTDTCPDCKGHGIVME